MQTNVTAEQKQTNSSQDLTQAREKSNKRMNLSSEKPFEWLNENSRKFLAAGYLGEGLCAEERIANIAKKSRRNSSNARLCRQILLLYV
jgi:ribonucleoside-diphosphate reductase alpha chain